MSYALRSDLVLAVETSCDDTCAAVVSGGRIVLSSHVASQDEIHALFGGVVPEVASRKHVEMITYVVQRALEEAGVTWKDIGGLAVTNGPGLIGSLIVGVSAMKAYCLATRLPLVGVNHLDAHVNSNFCDLPDYKGASEEFPALCLIVSGGHSDLLLLHSRSEAELLGCTRDDAAGEALDKAARVLGLGFPGGPAIQKAAQMGAPRFVLPRPALENSLDYSFAGLKTALLRLVEQLKSEDEWPVADLAASFQEAVVDTLVRNVQAAAQAYPVRQILLCGGVAANMLLRERIRQLAQKMNIAFHFPPLELCTDNAAMVGAAGWLQLVTGQHDNLALDVYSS